MEKLTRYFFIWILFFCLITLAFWVVPAPNLVAGSVDTTYTTLQKSGEIVAANSIPKWLAYLYGIGIIGIFCFGVFMGANKANPVLKRKIYPYLGVGVLLYLLVYSAMVFSWWGYTETNSMDYFLGLPKPTAWMFGLMFIPLLMSSIYITQFNRWIYTKEDDLRFKEIVERRKNDVVNKLLY